MSVAQPSERLEIIKQICDEKGYNFDYVDSFTQLLAKVSFDNNAAFFASINNFSCNSFIISPEIIYSLYFQQPCKV